MLFRSFANRGEDGSFGISFNDRVKDTIVDLVAINLIPLYKYIGKPALLVSLVMLIAAVVTFAFTVGVRMFHMVRQYGCGIWLVTVPFGACYHLIMTPMAWGGTLGKKLAQRVNRDALVNARKEAGMEEGLLYPGEELKDILQAQQGPEYWKGIFRALRGVEKPAREGAGEPQKEPGGGPLV